MPCIIGLLKYVGNSEERLLNAARQALGHVEETETEKEYKNWRKNERKQIWKDKMLHGQFMRQTEKEGGKERWLWLIEWHRIVNSIQTNGWLSEVELEEIKRELRHDVQRGETLDDVENHPDQREEGHTENGNDHPHEYSEINVEDVVCRMEREGCNADQIQTERRRLREGT